MTRWVREMRIALPPGDVGPEEPIRVPILAASNDRQDSRRLKRAGFSWLTYHGYHHGGRQNRYQREGIAVSVRVATGYTDKLRAHVTAVVLERVARVRARRQARVEAERAVIEALRKGA